MNFGGGQNKHHMAGRFFQRFQQCVESRAAEHVHLVDDIHFFSALAGGVVGFIPNGAHIVYTVVGGGVHFHNIQNAAIVNAAADLTFAAGIALHAVRAVYGLGKNFGTGGFAGAAHACEQIGMAYTVSRHLIAQRRYNGALAHHILKAARPPLAV